MEPTNDYPFAEIYAAFRRHIAMGRRCYQKFTCDGCGARLTIEQANVLYKTATCDQCNAITDIEKRGCNYILVMATPAGFPVSLPPEQM